MNLKNLIPDIVKLPLRSLIEFGSDRILNPTLPPARLRSHISPLWLDFRATGRDQIEFLIEMAGLRRTDAVLDIGCGVGRLALPLTEYLTGAGSYRGFDVFAEGINWCQDNISSQFQNFKFTQIHVSTPWSKGGPTADRYVFPYDDASFDFAYAGSLFTHLTAAAAQNYLRQTHRVLKPGARFVSTWLLYNASSNDIWSPPSMNILWPRKLESCRAIGSGPPEGSVLFDEIDVREWYQKFGFRILDPLRPDATYSPARKPKGDRTVGMNLYYSSSVIAIKL